MIDARGGDGIYVRTAGGVTGPMSQSDFERLIGTPAGRKIRRAYRLAGGAAFPIALRSGLVARRVCSCGAATHCVELAIVLLCALATGGVVWLLTTAPFKKERQSMRAGEYGTILVLVLIACVATVVTILTLARRWWRKSSEVFTSEV